MKAREFYEIRAKELIKELRESRNLSYADLALKLQAYGVVMTEKALRNRINRGVYNFGFAMLLMDAMSAEMLEIPKQDKMDPLGHRPGEALTKRGLKRRGLTPR